MVCPILNTCSYFKHTVHIVTGNTTYLPMNIMYLTGHYLILCIPFHHKQFFLSHFFKNCLIYVTVLKAPNKLVLCETKVYVRSR